jgi:hypothetical protein
MKASELVGVLEVLIYTYGDLEVGELEHHRDCGGTLKSVREVTAVDMRRYKGMPASEYAKYVDKPNVFSLGME